jgi:hypothetical protein
MTSKNFSTSPLAVSREIVKDIDISSSLHADCLSLQSPAVKETTMKLRFDLEISPRSLPKLLNGANDSANKKRGKEICELLMETQRIYGDLDRGSHLENYSSLSSTSARRLKNVDLIQQFDRRIQPSHLFAVGEDFHVWSDRILLVNHPKAGAGELAIRVFSGSTLSKLASAPILIADMKPNDSGNSIQWRPHRLPHCGELPVNYHGSGEKQIEHPDSGRLSQQSVFTLLSLSKLRACADQRSERHIHRLRHGAGNDRQRRRGGKRALHPGVIGKSETARVAVGGHLHSDARGVEEEEQ